MPEIQELKWVLLCCFCRCVCGGVVVLPNKPLNIVLRTVEANKADKARGKNKRSALVWGAEKNMIFHFSTCPATKRLENFIFRSVMNVFAFNYISMQYNGKATYKQNKLIYLPISLSLFFIYSY